MANVGIGLLKQFHVDLDLGRDRIYLAPRKDAPPFDRDRWGTRLDLIGDRLKIGFISPQGPAAAAGLKEGDEIVAVSKRWWGEGGSRLFQPRRLETRAGRQGRSSSAPTAARSR